MSRQDKVVGIVLIIATVLCIIGVITEKLKEKKRLEETNKLKAEIDYLFNVLKVNNPDVAAISIKGEWGVGEWIAIVLKQGMNHNATYAMFPNNMWKNYRVQFIEQ